MPGPRITLVGGGSYTWAPQFIRDIAITPELEDSTIVLHDIAPAPLELVTIAGGDAGGQSPVSAPVL
jgi:alpha-galactosidase/6-phospho-beta-glucosidase family protein